MSKLSEALKAHQTGVRAQPMDCVDFYSSIDEIRLTSYKTEYKLECVIGAAFYADSTDGREIEYAKQAVKRSILEGVFGEFRKDLYDIETALYRRDLTKAKELLDKIQQSMYDY